MQTKIDYNSDVFFKFAFGRNINTSTLLRGFLLRYLLPVDINDLSVDNPELIPHYIEDRNVILDIYMNRSSVEINIEMQKSLLSKYIYKRFQYYGARMIAFQLEKGDDFDLIKDVYQIVLIEDIDKRSPKLIEKYYAKGSIGDRNYPHYIHTTIYVYLPYIEVIAREKETLNEIEALLYLIHKGTLENIKYEEKEGVITVMERLHDEFVGNKGLVEAMMTRDQKRENFQAWHDMDVEEAKEEGNCIGKQDMLISLMKIKFPDENHDWIRECQLSELDKISQFLLTEISYNKLKASIKI